MMACVNTSVFDYALFLYVFFCQLLELRVVFSRRLTSIFESNNLKFLFM